MLQALSPDNTVPHLPDWHWVHVPGHTPGQVAFFRKKDLTTDRDAAYESVQRLAALNPNILIPGYGTVMEGAELNNGFLRLIAGWEDVALPDHGKWVRE